MRRFFGRLHKSKSVSDKTRHKIDCKTNDTDEENKASTSNGGIFHLTPSRTFDASKFYFCFKIFELINTLKKIIFKKY